MQIDRYIADSGLRTEPAKGYRRNLRHFEAWIDRKGVDEAEFSGLDFETYVEDEHPAWAQNTRRACLYALRGYARHMHGEDHPILRKKVTQEDPGEQPSLTAEQLQRVLEAPAIAPTDDRRARNRAMLLTYVETGCRASEAVGLRMDGLDLDGGHLSFIQKGGRLHVPVIGPETIEAIKAWLNIRPGYVAPGVKAVFVSIGGSTPGHKLTRFAVRDIMREISDDVGFRVYAHMLRRTMAVESIRRGAPMLVVAKQGGWKSMRMVERYARAISADDYRRYLPKLEGGQNGKEKA